MSTTRRPAPAATLAAGNTDAGLEFCLKLTRACASLTRRLDNGLSGLHGLSFADFMILYHLERAPGARLRRVDLADRLGLTASGVTRSLLPLEKLGLVSRQSDPRDARVGYATITAAGRRLLEHALTTVRQIADEATTVVEADHRDALSALLVRLSSLPSSGS